MKAIVESIFMLTSWRRVRCPHSGGRAHLPWIKEGQRIVLEKVEDRVQ